MVSASLMLKVIAQAERLATHSWEYGSLSLALIDWYSPEVSVFSTTAFPYNSIPVVDVNGTVALAYAKPLIRLNSTTLIDGAGKGRPWTLRNILLTISYRCSRRSSISWYSSSPNRPNNPILQIRSLTSSPTPPGRCSTLAQWRN
jgi:hypothetical protein